MQYNDNLEITSLKKLFKNWH